MATARQYEAFQYVYNLEQARYSELINRGKIYLSIVTFNLGILVFKADSAIDIAIRYKAIPVSLTLYLLATISFSVAFLFTVIALGIYKYEAICDLVEVIESFGESPPTDEDFLDKRLVDLAVACKRNSVKNEKRAKFLWTTSLIMLLGIFAHIVFYTYLFIIDRNTGG